MSPQCGCCGEHVGKLKQQVSVMRKEIKNLRQTLASAARAHRQHMASIQAALSNIGPGDLCKEQTAPPPPAEISQAALEKGNVQTVPIGYISSCFSEKNGTPRQPTVCGPSRAELRIQRTVFSNPEHPLLGLEHYSHVWIIFVFHKNGHLSYKAKVKPPRLDGQRVGVYSTRSPHRPNSLGLTLAKLDKIVGDTIHLSDIDMIAGTPVLDIKPYIPEYDSPSTRRGVDTPQTTSMPPYERADTLTLRPDSAADAQSDCEETDDDAEVGGLLSRDTSETDAPGTNSPPVSVQFSLPTHLHNVLEDAKAYITQVVCESEEEVCDSAKAKRIESTAVYPRYGEEAYSTIAGWIREPPVSSLEVRFTPSAESELAQFLPAQLSEGAILKKMSSASSCHAGAPEGDGPRFKFLHSQEEAAAAIRGVLSADPRSVYRRTCCRDRLFFFTLDTAHITCWFGQGFTEVLQVRPVEQHGA